MDVLRSGGVIGPRVQVSSGVKVNRKHTGLRAVVDPARRVDKLDSLHHYSFTGTMDVHSFGCEIPDKSPFLAGLQALSIREVVWVGARIAARIKHVQTERDIRDLFACIVAKLYPELRLRLSILMVVTQFNAVDDDRAFAQGTLGLRSHCSASQT